MSNLIDIGQRAGHRRLGRHGQRSTDRRRAGHPRPRRARARLDRARASPRERAAGHGHHRKSDLHDRRRDPRARAGRDLADPSDAPHQVTSAPTGRSSSTSSRRSVRDWDALPSQPPSSPSGRRATDRSVGSRSGRSALARDGRAAAARRHRPVPWPSAGRTRLRRPAIARSRPDRPPSASTMRWQSARPIPRPLAALRAGSARKNGSNRRAQSTSSRPIPRSSTSTTTSSPAFEISTSIGEPAGCTWRRC